MSEQAGDDGRAGRLSLDQILHCFDEIGIALKSVSDALVRQFHMFD